MIKICWIQQQVPWSKLSLPLSNNTTRVHVYVRRSNICELCRYERPIIQKVTNRWYKKWNICTHPHSNITTSWSRCWIPQIQSSKLSTCPFECANSCHTTKPTFHTKSRIESSKYHHRNSLSLSLSLPLKTTTNTVHVQTFELCHTSTFQKVTNKYNMNPKARFTQHHTSTSKCLSILVHSSLSPYVGSSSASSKHCNAQCTAYDTSKWFRSIYVSEHVSSES